MNDYIKEITLDVNCEKSPVKIFAGQYDIGRKFIITVTADGNDFSCSGCSVVCQGVRGNGTHFSFACTVNSNGKIETDLNLAFQSNGISIAKFVISDSTRSYSTQTLIIDVGSALLGNISTADEYIILTQLIEKIHQINESGGILVDTEILPDSNNPVSNKIIYIALADKANKSDLPVNASGYVDTDNIEIGAVGNDEMKPGSVDKSILAKSLQDEIDYKQKSAYITDTITTAEDLIALNDVSTVYNGVMSGFSTKFGQSSDTVYIGFRMWFVQASPKQAINYYRIILLNDGTIWIAYSKTVTTFTQVSYSKKQIDSLLKDKSNTDDVNTALADKADKTNMVSDEINVTDTATQYPSIEYLKGYYYNINEAYSCEEVDEKLNKKADKTTVVSGCEGVLTFALYSKFVLGQIGTNGTYNPDIKYRVISEDIMKFDYDLNISVNDGFTAFVVKYSDGSYVSMNSLSDTNGYTIPSGTEFKLHIRRNPENTSETANIGEFVNAVKFQTKIASDVAKKADTDDINAAIAAKMDKSVIEQGVAPMTIEGHTKDDFYALNCRYQKVSDYCDITFTANPKVAIDSPLVFEGLPFVAYNTSILSAYTGKNNPIKIEITNNTSTLTVTKISGEAFLAGETITFSIGHRIKS